MELRGASVVVLKEPKTLNILFMIIHRPCCKCKFYFLLHWILFHLLMDWRFGQLTELA